ncbi:MAG: hypothetical protein HYT46_03355 [Candidatus Vogelbacteria bacterium]|nr:hypothetical protein [Candidatus Vogelbacteria bacterium]
MFIPWWAIILGVVIIVGISASGKIRLEREIAELEERIEELENELGDKDREENYDM